ncbi:hypothetical protein CR194_09170 [Salipaludibacillus keqinensis]|uniref:Uncharacterized protein n=1 Tax=Salipaludibacillus keqinensis TaxID=2045207 RepID=A0A323TDA0_9BACI|nr:hypothetical protein [Salipaludibacillus keqinensis]PYZ93352.1 hypothetical protein CR194_09170 [Salipaludibacillus keqinensis]
MPRGTSWTEILFRTWPIWIAATAFALLNAAVLMMQDSPWKVTAAFTCGAQSLPIKWALIQLHGVIGVNMLLLTNEPLQFFTAEEEVGIFVFVVNRCR